MFHEGCRITERLSVCKCLKEHSLTVFLTSSETRWWRMGRTGHRQSLIEFSVSRISSLVEMVLVPPPHSLDMTNISCVSVPRVEDRKPDPEKKSSPCANRTLKNYYIESFTLHLLHQAEMKNTPRVIYIVSSVLAE